MSDNRDAIALHKRGRKTIMGILMGLAILLIFVVPQISWFDGLLKDYYPSLFGGFVAGILSSIIVSALLRVFERDFPEKVISDRFAVAAEHTVKTQFSSSALSETLGVVAERAVRESVRFDEIEKSVANLARSALDANRKFIPTSEFPASNEPNHAFQEALWADIRLTRSYFFVGQSAMHLSHRLQEVRESGAPRQLNLELTVFLPDPRSIEAVHSAAMYWKSSPTSVPNAREMPQQQEGEPADWVKTQQIRIVEGIYGLLKHRSAVKSLTLVLDPCPNFDRIESFDQSTWVTLFSDPESSYKYPRTLRFSASAPTAQMLRRNIEEARNHYMKIPGSYFDLSAAAIRSEQERLGLFLQILGNDLILELQAMAGAGQIGFSDDVSAALDFKGCVHE